QGLVFAQQSEQQVFGLNIRRSELAGLIAREENNASRLLRVAFEHMPILPEFPRNATPSAKPRPTSLLCIHIASSPKRYPPSSNPSSLTFGYFRLFNFHSL